MGLTAVLSVSNGLEDVLIKELSLWGYEARYWRPAKVLVGCQGLVDVVRLNFSLRTAERVYLLVNHGRFESLEDVRRIARESDLCVQRPCSFAVRGKRTGHHDFTSVDLARVVGAAIHDMGGFVVDLDSPDVELVAEVHDDEFFLFLNTSGEALYKRYGKTINHFAPLKSTIAAALVMIADPWEKDDVLLDPMCGSGTILGEAFSITRGYLPLLKRERGGFEKLFVSEEDVEVVKREVLSRSKRYSKPTMFLGADIKQRYVEECNLFWNQTLGFDIKFCRGDAATLSYVKKGEVDVVVTNPPYGIRMGSRWAIRRLYTKFAKSCASKEIRKLVVLTASPNLMKNALEDHGYHIVNDWDILYGKLWTRIIVARLPFFS